ncbi:MAG: 50S ribosomal protein L35ae [Candidatus Hecatellales archaeon]|nr:MAG: 50S ribosomal protein L35ae [Candidatus Hecatellales archaeon]
MVKEKTEGLTYATVINFRIGLKTQKNNELLLKIPNIEDSSRAAGYIGKKVVCLLGSKKIHGKIVDVHGKNGVVRARFKKGLPGDVVGTKVLVF